ncbi:MAG: ATP-dependent zinc metalloprotease FtsH [Actinomycetota bacterium]
MAISGVEDLVDRLRRVPKKTARAYKGWRLRRRRARAIKKKALSRKMTYLLLALLIALLSSFFGAVQYLSPDSEGTELALDELAALAQEKRIPAAEFKDEDKRLEGTFVSEPIVDEAEESDRGRRNANRNQRGEGRARGSNQNDASRTEQEPESKAPPGAGRFWFAYPSSDAAFGELSELLASAGASVTVDPQVTKGSVRAVQTFLLPLLILATFFGLLFATGRGAGSGIGDVMAFGTIGAKKQKRGLTQPVTFEDVAGADEAVEELREVVDYLKDPERYEEIGAVPPKGVLLFGPPGCGKTLLSRAVAGEAGVPFFSVAGAEFVESLVGVGAARVRDLFARVRAVSPAIVFIDELDAAARRRGHGGGSGGSDEREQTLNQLLVEMDGFEVSSGIVVIGATNRPDILDPALLRPGRCDRHITVDQPDLVGRQLILELHARGRPVSDTVDFAHVAKRTPGFSGADLANVVNESALLSVRARKPHIEMHELEEAIQRVLHGTQRRGRVLTKDERIRSAYHESGHAIIAAATGRGEEVHRVSILARGRGLGSTAIQRESDAYLLTRNQIYAQLVTAMGGLAAEELILGEPSTGAEADLEKATELARDMVGRYGFSPNLGRARLLASDAEQFLSNDPGLTQLSVRIHEEMDEEVRRILHAAETEALGLLGEHRDLLDGLARRLQDEETLEGAELEKVLHTVPQAEISFAASFTRATGNGQVGQDARRARKQSDQT